MVCSKTNVAMVIKKWRRHKLNITCIIPRAMATEDPGDEMDPVDVRLEKLFVSFCTFGLAKDGSALMDGTKFAKFCKDMGLLGKNLTPTDVDIIFAQSKP